MQVVRRVQASCACRARSTNDQAAGPQRTQPTCYKHLAHAALRLSTAGKFSSCMQTQLPQLTKCKAPGVCAANHGAVGVLELALHPHSGQSA